MSAQLDMKMFDKYLLEFKDLLVTIKEVKLGAQCTRIVLCFCFFVSGGKGSCPRIMYIVTGLKKYKCSSRDVCMSLSMQDLCDDVATHTGAVFLRQRWHYLLYKNKTPTNNV
jgi:hypothetical protein